jgi:hypothetical protein
MPKVKKRLSPAIIAALIGVAGTFAGVGGTIAVALRQKERVVTILATNLPEILQSKDQLIESLHEKLREQCPGPATPGLQPAAGATAVSPRIALISLTSPVRPGQTATITVQTEGHASCHIRVDYLSGPSKALGLEPTEADDGGRATWTWFVGSRTTPGKWPIRVTCYSKGNEAILPTEFEVK